MNPELVDVAKTLIELGANINAYRPGMLVDTFVVHRVIRWHILGVSTNILLQSTWKVIHVELTSY